jgi:hypothetical protein
MPAAAARRRLPADAAARATVPGEPRRARAVIARCRAWAGGRGGHGSYRVSSSQVPRARRGETLTRRCWAIASAACVVPSRPARRRQGRPKQGGVFRAPQAHGTQTRRRERFPVRVVPWSRVPALACCPAAWRGGRSALGTGHSPRQAADRAWRSAAPTPQSAPTTRRARAPCGRWRCKEPRARAAPTWRARSPATTARRRQPVPPTRSETPLPRVRLVSARSLGPRGWLGRRVGIKAPRGRGTARQAHMAGGGTQLGRRRPGAQRAARHTASRWSGFLPGRLRRA